MRVFLFNRNVAKGATYRKLPKEHAMSKSKMKVKQQQIWKWSYEWVKKG